MNRRSLLRASAAVAAGCGGFFASIPFVRSFLPSARAKALAEPVVIDLSKIPAGEVRAYLYRGETMLVLHRTPAMLANVAESAANVSEQTAVDDPAYVDPPYVDPASRSIDPEYLVVSGVCTHLGCVPRIKDEANKQSIGEWWTGGFICPCHGSGFDYAGRVVRGPAPRNLPVPPHRYIDPNHLVIGEEPRPT